MATIGTTTPLTTFDEKGITYLAATNAGWLPYLVNVQSKEAICARLGHTR